MLRIGKTVKKLFLLFKTEKFFSEKVISYNNGNHGMGYTSPGKTDA